MAIVPTRAEVEEDGEEEDGDDDERGVKDSMRGAPSFSGSNYKSSHRLICVT